MKQKQKNAVNEYTIYKKNNKQKVYTVGPCKGRVFKKGKNIFERTFEVIVSHNNNDEILEIKIYKLNNKIKQFRKNYTYSTGEIYYKKLRQKTILK